VTTTDSARTAPDPALCEAIDPVAGTVSVSGHLTVQGVDLVRGTVEHLYRLGHASILLDMAGVEAADDRALPMLQALQDDVAGCGGRVVLRHGG
jgi:hypothetical protein